MKSVKIISIGPETTICESHAASMDAHTHTICTQKNEIGFFLLVSFEQGEKHAGLLIEINRHFFAIRNCFLYGNACSK